MNPADFPKEHYSRGTAADGNSTIVMPSSQSYSVAIG